MAGLECTAEYEAQCQQRQRRFVLATNVLDEDTYPAERLLREYKAQQHASAAFASSKTLSSSPAVSLSKSLNGWKPSPSSWP